MDFRNWNWFAASRGERQSLPATLPESHEFIRKKVSPVYATLAALSGEIEPNIKTLHRLCKKLQRGEDVQCAVCQQDIFKTGHRVDCQLVLKHHAITKHLNPSEI